MDSCRRDRRWLAGVLLGACIAAATGCKSAPSSGARGEASAPPAPADTPAEGITGAPRPAPKPAPPPVRDELERARDQGVTPTAGAGDIVLIRADETRDGRVVAQLSWVVSLTGDGGRHACSATWIDERVLVTAAHCVDRGAPLALDGETLATDDEARACGHGDCSAPFADGDLGSIANDIATVATSAARAPAGAPPRLARVLGPPSRGAYLLSGLHRQARAVCRLQAGQGVGAGGGTVDLGESGSAVIAFRGGAPVVVGVVSHRVDSGDGWFFAMVPAVMPWPRAAGRAPQPLEVLADELEEIPECRP